MRRNLILGRCLSKERRGMLPIRRASAAIGDERDLHQRGVDMADHDRTPQQPACLGQVSRYEVADQIPHRQLHECIGIAAISSSGEQRDRLDDTASVGEPARPIDSLIAHDDPYRPCAAKNKGRRSLSGPKVVLIGV